MKSTGQAVEQIIRSKSFIEEALEENLINLSSLARFIKQEVEEVLGKEVKEGALVMALKRYVSRADPKINIKLQKAMANLGEITVRSQLTDYTFRNSDSMLDNQKELLKSISQRGEIFYNLSRGVNETTIVISNIMNDEVERIFKKEKLVSRITHLSSVTIKLPINNTKVTGLYYSLLRKTTWERINILEVVSTTNEFTIVVDESEAGHVFNVFKNL
jgi:hypothetical protein